MMYEMTISRPQNYGEGLRNLPRGLSTKSLGHLLGYFKVIRLAYGLPWEKFVRKKVETSSTQRLPQGNSSWLGFKSTRWKEKDYNAGFRRSFFSEIIRS